MHARPFHTSVLSYNRCVRDGCNCDNLNVRWNALKLAREDRIATLSFNSKNRSAISCGQRPGWKRLSGK